MVWGSNSGHRLLFVLAGLPEASCAADGAGLNRESWTSITHYLEAQKQKWMSYSFILQRQAYEENQ
jgi:hypothetical protein